MSIPLPVYAHVAERVRLFGRHADLTPLQTFVYQHTPPRKEASQLFRKQLQAAIDQAYKAGEEHGRAVAEQHARVDRDFYSA